MSLSRSRSATQPLSTPDLGTLVRTAPRWVLVAGFATAAAGANLLLGMGAAVGNRVFLLALLVGVVPAALIAFGALVEAHRALLAWAALAITFTAYAPLAQPLPLPGGLPIFLTDTLVLLAVGAWIASRLSGEGRRTEARLSVVFTWPLAVFSVTLLLGIWEGHQRYGAGILGQPLRIILYSAIALTITDTTPTNAWRAITRVFYAGAVVQLFYAVYYLSSGTSQTDATLLSTGGVRILALSTAIYLTGSLICALLNLELERGSIRQLGHAAIAGIALFGIIVSFGRTTYAAVALIVPLLLLTRRYMRRTILLVLPLSAPLLVIAVLLVPTVAPDLYPTLESRISGTSTSDANVAWRDRAREAALEDVDGEWLTGVGFGRTIRFVFEGTVIRISDDPHNSFVYLLAGGGVLALGSFLLLCVLYVLDALRRLRGADAVSQALIVWALGTWLAFMVNTASGPVLSSPIMLLTIWILFALPSLVPLNKTTRLA